MREFEVTIDEIKALISREDPLDRKKGIHKLFWPHEFQRFPEAQELVVLMVADPDAEVRDAVLDVISQNIEYFKDPLSLLKRFIDDPSWEIQMNVGGAVAACLQRVVGPQKCFEEFASLDPNKYWPIHIGMQMLFELDKDWFRQSEEAKNYLCASFHGNYKKEMRLAALDTICRCLPYQDDRMITAIKAAVEDEDPEIRVTGRWLRECWILTDDLVKSRKN